jgi:hypothetical protein
MTAKSSKSAEEQAAIATAKEMRARDAVLAMREYQLERATVAARTERLREQRLARDRDAAKAAQQPAAPAKKKAGKKTSSTISP